MVMIASQPFACARVADRQREERKACGEQQKVEHDRSPDGTDSRQVVATP
jgi:hypothetical protein